MKNFSNNMNSQGLKTSNQFRMDSKISNKYNSYKIKNKRKSKRKIRNKNNNMGMKN